MEVLRAAHGRRHRAPSPACEQVVEIMCETFGFDPVGGVGDSAIISRRSTFRSRAASSSAGRRTTSRSRTGSTEIEPTVFVP